MTSPLDQAFALLAAGRAGDARVAFDAVLAQWPDLPDAHRGRALVDARLGRADLAIAALSLAVARFPSHALLHADLGRLLASGGAHADAIGPFERALELAPGTADLWFLLGVTLERLQRFHGALDALREAERLAPGNPRIAAALAGLELAHGDPAAAAALFAPLLRARPDDIDLRLKAGEALSRVGDHAAARRVFRDGLVQGPDSADLWMGAAQADDDLGDRDAARSGYERALALRPGWAFPIAGLLSLQRGKADDTLRALAHERLDDPATRDDERALIGFELGKALDARGEHAEAFHLWRIANTARRAGAGDFDRDRFDAWVERLAALRRGDLPRPAHASAVDERPLFIVGMPRSGTTLTEQILAAHPQVHGCGELPDIARSAGRLAHALHTADWILEARRATPDLLEVEARRFLATASRHAPADAARLVDKAPLNLFHLPLIASLFPRARIVWCRRDPRDVALSIYSENFSVESTFATDLADIAAVARAQSRLMAHFRELLDLPVLEFSYESLTASPEGESRRLVDFAGLPWDDACLDFHASTAGVQTPSRWQVRQPVHQRSIERWRRHEADLAPYLAALAPHEG